MDNEIVRVIATFGLLGAALGFIVGTSAYQFIRSITEHVVLPVIGAFFRVDDLQSASFQLNGSRVKVGEVLLSFIDLILVLLIVYALLFYILKPHVSSIIDEKSRTDKKLIEQNEAIISHLRNLSDRG